MFIKNRLEIDNSNFKPKMHTQKNQNAHEHSKLDEMMKFKEK